ncbi:cytochrome P450 [Gigaspora rosea]|uniref:Cytochrome P450 n=1 Tax=Gigaspora rosea TaxID=44941 RepID=A0A397W768_9GLOM|nr:cytochrome P450 [Gigaspora rosea]
MVNNIFLKNEPPIVPYAFPFIGHTIDYFTNTENFIKKCHKQVIREELSNDMRQYTTRIQDAAKKSIDKYIGDCKTQKCIKLFQQMIQQIVAIPVVSVIVGEDLSNDDELVNTFAHLTQDIASALSLPPFLNFIHPSLHTNFFVFRMKHTNHPYKKHKQVIIDRIIRIIKEREHKKKELGSTWKPPADILQLFINVSTKDGLVDVKKVADCLIDIIFAAMHTTSNAISNVLYEYGGRPEYWKELFEENQKISLEIKDGYLTSKDINNMIKLDSFIRETLKYWNAIGRNVLMYITEIQGTDSKTSPGRFFALHVIKIILYLLIEKYKIVTENGTIVKPVFAGSFLIPNSEGIILENRKM